LPTLTAGNSAAGGLGASSASLSFSEGSSTDVIQMPGITSNGVFLKVQASGVLPLLVNCTWYFGAFL
jgi:hypothetical protein